MANTDFPPKNYAQFWCQEMVKALLGLGVDHFFIAPGSRSTPLVSALARNARAKKILGIDERSLAFCALGYAKKNQKPGVLVVTSGTAVANLLPAVVEASSSAVPLLIISADRPYELRDCGANQTIIQPGLFSHFVLKAFDLGPPSQRLGLQKSTAIFYNAVRTSLGAKSGPVHINLQFVEPLANVENPSEKFELVAGEVLGSLPEDDHIVPTAMSHRVISRPDRGIHSSPQTMFWETAEASNGLIIVGELLPQSGQDKILELSEKLKWPIFADVTSNLRLRSHPNILSHFDLMLINKTVRDTCDFGAVLYFGGRFVSKRLLELLPKLKCDKFLRLSIQEDFIDPDGRFAQEYVGDINLFLENKLKGISAKLENTNLLKLKKSHQEIACIIKNFLEANPDNEAGLAQRLIKNIFEPVNLFISSSMPIRDVDMFAEATKISGIDIYANRGASGIDGIIASAVGVSLADAKPTIVLVGDVAFLHDTNGLMLLGQSQKPILIVVVNNGGGQIFSFLPIGKEEDILSPYFTTPHAVNLSHLCEAHGISHKKTKHVRDLDMLLADFFKRRKSQVIELEINSVKNLKEHQEIFQTISNLNLG